MYICNSICGYGILSQLVKVNAINFKVTKNADVEDINLVLNAKDLLKQKRQAIIKDKSKKQGATGKYVNATSDGKYKWND